MLNDLFRTYKKIIIFVLILLCGIVFWFYGCHRQNSPAETSEWEKVVLEDSGGCEYRFETGDFEGTVSFGTQGYLVEDRTLPVTLNLNCKEDSFAGILKITLPGNDGRGVAYQSAINCTGGITNKVVMEVPGLGNVSYFCFEILDQFGVTKFFEIINPSETENFSKDHELSAKTICLGVLSEQGDALQYLDQMELDMGGETVKLNLIHLSETNFPTDIRQLEALSGIIMESFNSSKLSQMQLSCLESWVKEKGGNLLLDTGLDMDEVLSGIGQTFGVSAGELTEKRYHFSDGTASIGNVYLTDCNLEFAKKKEWEVSALSSPVSMYSKAYGRGQVSVLVFSLMDDIFLQWTGRDQAISVLFKEYLKPTKEDSQLDDTSLWYIKKALYAFRSSQLPNTFYYGLFFIVYLFMLSFFSYYLLRRIKKREYIWVVVPVIAVFFTICLLIRARGMAGPADNSFSTIRVIDEKNDQDDVYFLYQNDEGESCNVSLLSSVIAVEPLDYNYVTDEVDVSSLRGANQDFTISNTKNGFDIDFEETVPGISQVLKYSLKTEQSKNDEPYFRYDITGNYTSFEGEISNISPYDFEKVVLIRGTQYVIADGLEEGETLRINQKDVECWTNYDEENHIFSEEEESTVMGNLLEYLQQQYISDNENLETLLVIGITKDNEFQLFADDNALKNHLTVFINHYDIPFLENTEYIADINAACLDEEDSNLSLKKGVLEKNKTEAVYTFDSGKVAWALIRNRDDFEGAIYAYNYETQEEEMILGEKDSVLNCEALELYLSDMNKMKLTFYTKEGTDYGAAPMLSVAMKDMD